MRPWARDDLLPSPEEKAKRKKKKTKKKQISTATDKNASTGTSKASRCLDLTITCFAAPHLHIKNSSRYPNVVEKVDGLPYFIDYIIA